MTAEIIRPRAFIRGPAVRCLGDARKAASECLATFRLAEIATGIDALEAQGEDLERLHAKIEELLKGRTIL